MTSWLKIVGTNHISKDSIDEIKSVFLDYKPDVIAVELDKGRLDGLLYEENNPNKKQSMNFSSIRKVGVKGFLFLFFGKLMQQKMGKLVGMKPGSEMLFAVKLAKNNNLNLALIDRPITITIKRLFKNLTFKEKMRFLGDLVFAPFKQKQAKELQEKTGLDKRSMSSLFSKVPDSELIDKLMFALKGRYPTFYTVLVDERNHYMARKLVILHKKNPNQKFLVVVGAGHAKEMIELVKHYSFAIELV
ncbi:MAG: TraB/GumN family protein [Bacteroidales bacterium]|nr:TraB/GumN family protein [Candidatus Woesearchaeota archaeon]MBN2892743.1 TraB/GumN family protein [Bacteroidales bacterium]